MTHRVKAQRQAFILAMQMGLIGQIDLGYLRREERRTRFSQELGFHNRQKSQCHEKYLILNLKCMLFAIINQKAILPFNLSNDTMQQFYFLLSVQNLQIIN